jgi:hypothetical protein
MKHLIDYWSERAVGAFVKPADNAKEEDGLLSANVSWIRSSRGGRGIEPGKS